MERGGRAGGARGLTLAELMVALGLLALAALAIIGVFTVLIQASAKNREQAQAELLAQNLLERACAEGEPAWGVRGRKGERQELQLSEDGTRYFYQVDPVSLSEAEQGPEDDRDGRSWAVTVTVGWWLDSAAEELDASREGFGQQFVKAYRIVYFRDGGRW